MEPGGVERLAYAQRAVHDPQPDGGSRATPANRTGLLQITGGKDRDGHAHGGQGPATRAGGGVSRNLASRHQSARQEQTGPKHDASQSPGAVRRKGLGAETDARERPAARGRVLV